MELAASRDLILEVLGDACLALRTRLSPRAFCPLDHSLSCGLDGIGSVAIDLRPQAALGALELTDHGDRSAAVAAGLEQGGGLDLVGIEGSHAAVTPCCCAAILA
jgi:hypothetical protein